MEIELTRIGQAAPAAAIPGTGPDLLLIAPAPAIRGLTDGLLGSDERRASASLDFVLGGPEAAKRKAKDEEEGGTEEEEEGDEDEADEDEDEEDADEDEDFDDDEDEDDEDEDEDEEDEEFDDPDEEDDDFDDDDEDFEDEDE
jgi:hypothetical protein